MSLEVDVADLVASGVAVTTQGEELAARHHGADGRIEAAEAGWRGQSAVALAATAQEWTAATAALLARLRDHASALHTAAEAFAEHEQRSAEALAALATPR